MNYSRINEGAIWKIKTNKSNSELALLIRVDDNMITAVVEDKQEYSMSVNYNGKTYNFNPAKFITIYQDDLYEYICTVSKNILELLKLLAVSYILPANHVAAATAYSLNLYKGDVSEYDGIIDSAIHRIKHICEEFDINQIININSKNVHIDLSKKCIPMQVIDDSRIFGIPKTLWKSYVYCNGLAGSVLAETLHLSRKSFLVNSSDDIITDKITINKMFHNCFPDRDKFVDLLYNNTIIGKSLGVEYCNAISPFVYILMNTESIEADPNKDAYDQLPGVGKMFADDILNNAEEYIIYDRLLAKITSSYSLAKIGLTHKYHKPFFMAIGVQCDRTITVQRNILGYTRSQMINYLVHNDLIGEYKAANITKASTYDRTKEISNQDITPKMIEDVPDEFKKQYRDSYIIKMFNADDRFMPIVYIAYKEKSWVNKIDVNTDISVTLLAIVDHIKKSDDMFLELSALYCVSTQMLHKVGLSVANRLALLGYFGLDGYKD